MSASDSPLGGPRHSQNTREGQIESIGMFASGLGARRIKIIGAVAFGVVLLLVLITAL